MPETLTIDANPIDSEDFDNEQTVWVPHQRKDDLWVPFLVTSVQPRPEFVVDGSAFMIAGSSERAALHYAVNLYKKKPEIGTRFRLESMSLDDAKDLAKGIEAYGVIVVQSDDIRVQPKFHYVK